MTKVYTLIQFIDGEASVEVYSSILDAMEAGERLARDCEFEEEDKGFWTCPSDSGDYIDIEVKELL